MAYCDRVACDDADVADRRWRLPGAQRRDPRHRPQGRASSTATRCIGFHDAWDGVHGTAHDAADGRVDARHAARAAARCSGHGGGARSTSTAASTRSSETFADMGLDALDRRRRQRVAERRLPAVHRASACRSSACRRRSTTTSTAPTCTFGFNTAVQIATDAIDRLHTTAESHDRVMVVEVMGRHSGWIATYAGIAGGATVVLIPELPFDIDDVCDRDPPPPRARSLRLDRRRRRGRRAEGGLARPRRAREYDQFGHVRLGGIGNIVARRDRTPHRFRDPPGAARPRPARRHADRLRPRAVDTLRRRRHRRRARPGVGRHGRARGRHDHADAARRWPSAGPVGVDLSLFENVAEVFFA